MKRILLGFALLFSFAVFAPVGISYADEFKPADVCAKVDKSQGVPEYCKTITNNDDPITGSDGVLKRIVDLVAFVAGIVAVIMIIFGGFRYITSTGEPEKAAAARKTLIYAIVGLVIVILAQTIVSFVLRQINV
jgi:type IV secretory pathway VirB2 component (pilin)